MNYARQFAHHAFITVATTVVTGALFYVLRILLYQHLTPEEYGLFYTLFSFVMIVQTVATFGFDPGLVPYVTKFRELDDYAGMKSLVLGSLVPQGLTTALVAAVFVVGAGPVAAWVADVPAAPALLRILALHAVCVLLFKVGQQTLLGLQAMVWRNASDLARAVVCVGGAAWMLHNGWGVYATAAAYTAGALTEVLVQAVALSFAAPRLYREPASWRPALVREAFESGKWLSIAFGGIVIFSSVDTVVIKLVRDNLADAAAYQIALPTATILYSLMIAAGLSLLPTVRTAWLRGEREALTDGVERLYRAAVGLMLPAGAVLACFSETLMVTLFGPNVLNAKDAFDVMAIGGIAFFIAYLNLHVLAGIDQPRAAGVSVISGLLLNLTVNPLLTYSFGIRGAAAAGVLGYTLTAAIGLYAIRRELRIRLPLVSICAAAVAGAGAAGAAVFTYSLTPLPSAINAALWGGLWWLIAVVALELGQFIELRSLLSAAKRSRRPQ